jgi:hypothetical protein
VNDDAHGGWVEALDAYERLLDQHAAALDAVESDRIPDTVIDVTPPVLEMALPAVLRGRAEALARRTDDLIERGRELAESRRPRPATTRPRRARSSFAPSSFDRRA